MYTGGRKKQGPDSFQVFFSFTALIVRLLKEDFDELYMFLPPPEVEDKKRKFLYKFFHPCLGPEQFFRFLVSFVPIIEWLPQYSWKRNLLGDFMAGITVGIMHVPQGKQFHCMNTLIVEFALSSPFYSCPSCLSPPLLLSASFPFLWAGRVCWVCCSQ